VLYYFSVIVSNGLGRAAADTAVGTFKSLYIWLDPAGRTPLFVLPDELKSAPQSESGGVNFLAVKSKKIP
jgi:hypothetical protein